MVRVAAANALPADGAGAAAAAAAAGEAAATRALRPQPGGGGGGSLGAAPEGEAMDGGAGLFHSAVGRFVLPFCLAPTMRKQQGGLAAVDIAAPQQLSELQAAIQHLEGAADAPCALRYPACTALGLAHFLPRVRCAAADAWPWSA